MPIIISGAADSVLLFFSGLIQSGRDAVVNLLAEFFALGQRIEDFFGALPGIVFARVQEVVSGAVTAILAVSVADEIVWLVFKPAYSFSSL